MSEPEPASAVQTLLRLCIMVGTVVVGGMAFHLYGPPKSEINRWIDRLARAAKELGADPRDEGVAPAVAQAPSTRATGELEPGAPTTVVDPNVRPAAALVPVKRKLAPLPPLDAPAGAPEKDPEVQALLAQLRAMGVDHMRLAPWGSERDFYHFECSATTPGGAGFRRHFDAIDRRAEDAVARVLRDVQEWRDEGAGSN